MMSEKTLDFTPPGLICFFMYLTGELATYKRRFPGDKGLPVVGDSRT
jgi:hypothetical protein